MLSLIVAAYLAIGAQYAILTPRWQVPDEPAHYNYIRFIVDTGALPTLDEGEYQQGYLAELTSRKFPPELSIAPLQYESWQPPLYYLLAAPLFLISSGDLLALRLFSLALGAGVIIFTCLAAREAVPRHPGVAIVAAGFTAFIPQHIAMMAGVNNDSLSELLIAVGLWLILRLHNNRSEANHFEVWNLKFEILNLEFVLLGFVIGLAFITKSQAYVLLPIAGLVLAFKWRRNFQSSASQTTNRHLPITQLAALFLPALLIGSLWWTRNIAVYGWPDFMGAIRHDHVVADQPRTNEWIEQLGATEVLRRFGQTTFQSFWGQFGWMGVVMDSRVYVVLLVYTVLLTGGAAGYWRTRGLEDSPISNYYLLTASALLTLGLYLFYNLTYVQHQGRYFFPALVPIGLAASLSLWRWGAMIEAATRRKIGWLAPVGALAGMAALSVWSLYRFIIPALR